MITHAQRYLLAVLIGLGITSVTAWLTNAWLVSFLVLFVLVAGWHIRHLLLMDRWLRKPQKTAASAWTIPLTAGIWQQLYDRLAFLHRQSKKQQAVLRRTLKEFRTVTESFPEPAVILDEQQRLVWFNSAAVNDLGLRKPADLQQPVGNILRTPAFTNWLDEQSPRPLDIDSPTNSSIKLNVRLFVLGKHRRLLQFRDVTQLRNLETIRRDFVANVSHELRTPLTVLIGYLESLDDTEEPELRMISQRMGEQTRLMRTLIDDLIEISRLQSPEARRSEQSVNMAALMAQLKEQTESLNSNDHSIEFQLDTEQQLTGLSKDLESAFSNLITNAMRYTPAGGNIKVRFYVADGKGIFAVSDNGIGIPRDDIPRLTERFYRVAKDRARDSGGSGLGLSIVKHVLNAHDATLEISSELEHGSEFRCVFPAERLTSSTSTVN